MSHLGRPFWIFVIGFGSIVAVAGGLFALALTHAESLERSQAALRLTAQKTDYALAMRDAVRKRGFSLAIVQTMDSYFDRDDELQRFNGYAADLVTALDELLALSVTPEEQAIIDRFQAKVRKGRERIERAMSALVEDPVAARMSGMVMDAVRFQAGILHEMNDLVEHLKLGEQERIAYTAKTNRDAYRLFVALGTLALLLSIGIATTVIARERDHKKAIAHEIEDRKRAELRVRNLNADLERRVESRTEALDIAKSEADRLRQRLIDALDCIPDGFTVVDADGRLELFNERYREFYPLVAPYIKTGVLFSDLVQAAFDVGQYSCVTGDVEDWVEKRLAIHEKAESDFVQHLADGRRLRVVERRMRDGSIVSVRTDITDTVKAKEEAEAANRAKTEFLSNMSHELRTPLNAIIGFSQLLFDDPDSPLSEAQVDEVTHIYEAGEHLLSLIEDVLDFAKIESGKMAIEISDTPLLPIVEECRVMLHSQAQKYRIAIHVDAVSLDAVWVRADPDRLRQILLNLMSNAVKYNKPQGQVTVHGDLDKGRFRIGVTDTGNGVPEDQVENLFKPFSRLGLEASSIEGTGIGLSLTKNLAEMMGGDITFDSVAGKGTTFWLALDPGEEPRMVEASTGLAQGTGFAANVPPLPLGGGGPPPDVLQVLCIEDNPVNMLVLEKMLARLPTVEFAGVENAEKGVEWARRRRPDLVFMDIGLPGMDGFQALRTLREDENTADIPVIALSADASEHTVRSGLDEGFLDYLEKPIKFEVLSAAIDAVRSR